MAEEIKWQQRLSTALEIAQKEGKGVLVDFTSPA
jgi:hypothetical protein